MKSSIPLSYRSFPLDLLLNDLEDVYLMYNHTISVGVVRCVKVLYMVALHVYMQLLGPKNWSLVYDHQCKWQESSHDLVLKETDHVFNCYLTNGFMNAILASVVHFQWRRKWHHCGSLERNQIHLIQTPAMIHNVGWDLTSPLEPNWMVVSCGRMGTAGWNNGQSPYALKVKIPPDPS